MRQYVVYLTFAIPFFKCIVYLLQQLHFFCKDAAETGNVEIMKLLLEFGTKIQANNIGVTPIISAAMCGNSEVVELLLPLSQNRMERHNAFKLLGMGSNK